MNLHIVEDARADFEIPALPPRPVVLPGVKAISRRPALKAALLGSAAVCVIGVLAVPHTAHAQVVETRNGTGGAHGSDMFFPVAVAIGGDAGDGGTASALNGVNTVDQSTSLAAALRLTSQGGVGGEGGFGISGIGYGEGGDGGDGGDGGSINYRNDARLTTVDGVGFYAASFGGRGGSGGEGVAAVGAGKGGSGGGGGDGGALSVEHAGQIYTQGSLSHGLVVRSVGGVAGTGGLSGGLFAGLETGVKAGGDGGSAEALVTGSIETSDDTSYGMLVQSIGGAGGAAGSSGAAFYASGGDGGSGGSGKLAKATIGAGGSVLTHGTDSIGVLVQSIGGGGGAGAGAGAIGAVGGSGGSGVNGGIAEAQIDGDLTTGGERAYGVLVQSIGGGGGDGSGSGGLVAIGGSGSVGGQGDQVTITTGADASIRTGGADAHALFAQSIGGGGGTGGGSGGLIAIGGDGSAAGASATVTIASQGDIITTGDRSHAIFGQSIGGGGGAGAGAGGIVGIGGKGGSGGAGGQVILSNGGDILTTGFDSHGMFGQSVGGGGGSGATAGGLVGIGGVGSVGGAGQGVTLTNSGFIETLNDRSFGVLAQSIGGGGGFGGGGAGLIGVGGSGLGGGAGGDVTLNNPGDVITRGKDAYGLFAQSVGGGGGAGGFGGGMVAVGGQGDAGGAGGLVTVNATGSVQTFGDGSGGVFAQSVGGGGGAGGSATSVGVFLNVSVGGSAGGGGAGGDVTVNHSGLISTEGDFAAGLFVQSVGGGGGKGGYGAGGSAGAFGNLSFGIGGKGGAGGAGGLVIVDGDADISTLGVDSHAVFAQSIGGGGGAGGFAVAASIAGGPVGIAGAIAIGGEGNTGGAGGVVDVTANGDIRTSGDRSAGIYAQSVGGGGGAGGWSSSLAIGAGAVGGAINVGVGGKADGGGMGDTVTVVAGGDIVTLGADSYGVLAQSIGGGGGTGGFSAGGAVGAGKVAGAASVNVGGGGGSGGESSLVKVTTTGDIATTGDRAVGILAQSIGGGGGAGGWSGGVAGAGGVTSGAVNVTLGGAGAGGGDGDDVRVNAGGNIWTEGHDAAGVLAQSIGGGGGLGGFTVGLAAAGGQTAGSANVSVGGKADDGGDATKVTVIADGQIATRGDRSNGITAQSIGGGGGNGGWSSSLAVAGGQTAGSASVSVGGFAGAGGAAGEVEVTTNGPIFTLGDDSSGVFAQSIGGGGGSGGFSVAAGVGAGQNAGSGALSIGGFGDFGGDAAKVTVNALNQISTEGDRANGVTAQSIGGGGGNGGWSGVLAVGAGQTGGAAVIGIGGGGKGGGAGDIVIVNASGDILTRGADASGILAQSIGGGGGNGGFSVAGSVAAGQTAGGASVSVGGFGEGGGDASTVTVTSDGDIRTRGDRARGVTAQSIGGGGGNGGWSGSIQVAAGQTAGGASVSIGGFGDDGGVAAKVTVVSNGSIGTLGDDATGILAQAIGGGGGSGGFSVSAGIAAGKDAGSGSLSIGGFAGGGGDGAEVEVASNDLIVTEGDRAHGVLAQSIGGGGGNGGWSGSIAGAFSPGQNAAVGLSLGGFGGEGGDGKRVDVDSTVGVATLGDAAHGLFAQSIGGGGGSGGFSISGAISGGKDTVAITAAIGGTGGKGGDGGVVDVFSDGVLTTDGIGSHGLFAQSVGGGGGDGGWSGALSGGLSPNKSMNISFAVGGFGNDGGAGGDVFVENLADVGTLGDASHGLFAQSIGGGGGNGGFTFGANLGGTKSTNLGGRVGGSGGLGTEGGDVDLETSGLIVTRGDGSHGVFAQSIGGGGGSGGSAGGVALSGSDSVNLELSMGGLGGGGGFGGDVDVRNSGIIDTTGEASYGVFAQSVGGGGGAGGLAGFDENAFTEYVGLGSGTLSFGSNSKNITVHLGGAGGAGNDGGDVTVTNAGQMTTRGAQSHVIYAQSVGGGGGQAGVATSTAAAFGAGKNGAYNITMGGQGLGGGDGGDVTVVNTGALAALGGGSNGVFAQSVGGGGGNGGDATGYALVFSSKAKGTKKSQQVSVSVGGSGGAAGDGGVVTINNSGQIYTADAESNGVFAQSIGGGGGNGGLVGDNGGEIGFFLDQANKSEAKGGQISIGGQGAGGGDGGGVTVANSGLILTEGARSNGVFAQSIGGGGGNGGSGLAGEISVGGFGGIAGDGGDVTVVNSGVIATEGFLSRGIFAQSIGGGGGNGGATDYDIAQGTDGAPYSYRDDFSDALEVKGDLEAAFELAASVVAPAFGVAVGGAGGAAGDGGDVTVVNTGSIQTSGVLAHGIFAQSVGGGGGTGGEGAIGQVGQIVFSGVGGSAGDGGDVTVTHTGDIVTSGYGAYGIFAQSVGGGGGVAGDVSLGIGDFQLKYGINPFAGAGGNGGDVTVTSTGDIVIQGVGGMGIFAQSVGGGGGLYGSAIGLGFIGSFGNDGTAGKVVVNHTGDVFAVDKNGIAAVFQSAAKDGVADITATLNGAFRGGSVYGKGVYIDGGRNNLVTINGSASAVSNLAIEGTTGNDTVINNGVVVGDIDLDGGSDLLVPFAVGGLAVPAEVNAFVNTADAAFVSLDYVDLAGGLLTNHGLLAPGDVGETQTTAVDGAFLQTAGATFDLDIDFALTGVDQETDRLSMNGAASVGGLFDLRVNNVSEIKPGDHLVTLVSAEGGLVNTGARLDAPTSAVAKFTLETTAEALNMRYVVDFSPTDTDFNDNRTEVGDYINAVQTAGGSDAFDPVVDMLFWIPDGGTLGAVYDSWMPEVYLDNLVGATFASGRFTDAMTACPEASIRVGVPGQSCVWARALGGRTDFDTTYDTYAFEEDSRGLEAGGEIRLWNSRFTLGAAVSLEKVNGELVDRARSEGDRRQVGLSLRGDFGVADVALAVTAGRGLMDVQRGVVTPTGLAAAEGRQEFRFQQVTAQVSRTFGDSSLYVRPTMEASVARYQQEGFTELGAGALNLIVRPHDEEVVRVRPGVEVGGEFAMGSTIVRPYVSAGVSAAIGGANPGVIAEFQGIDGLADPFTTTQPLDKTLTDVRLGFDLVGDNGLSARVGYVGQFGDKTDHHSVGVRIAKAF